MHWGYGALASVLLLGSVGAEVAHQSADAFHAQAGHLEAEWHQDVKAGLSARALAPISLHLEALSQQQWGPVPAEWIPNYLSAPVHQLQHETIRLMAKTTSTAATQAAAELAHLGKVEGQFGAGRQALRQKELHQSTTPQALNQLASRWSAEAAQFQSQVNALAAAGGPEQDGVPAQVASQVSQLDSLVTRAQNLGASTSAADTPLDAVKKFRNQPPAVQLSQLSSVLSQLKSAEASLTSSIAAASALLDPQGMGALPAAIQHYLDGRQGDVAVAVYDAATQQSFSVNGSAQFDTASIIKASILGTLLDQAQAANTPLTAAQQNVAVPMIEDSNNSDATTLWNAEGGAPAVASFVHALGMNSTTPNLAWGLTKTTAPDQVKLMSALAYGTPVLTAASRSYELSLMEHVTSWEAWGVTGGVPSSATVALKNGWLPRPSGWVINSIGWVSGSGRNYTIAILSNQDPGEQYGIDTAKALSGLIWNALAPS